MNWDKRDRVIRYFLCQILLCSVDINRIWNLDFCLNHTLFIFMADTDISMRRWKYAFSPFNIPQRRSDFNLFKTWLDRFYAVAFRKKLYTRIDELQTDLDNWVDWYNTERTHSGRYCYGKTPIATFEESLNLAKAKFLDNNLQSTNEQNTIVCQMK